MPCLILDASDIGNRARDPVQKNLKQSGQDSDKWVIFHEHDSMIFGLRKYKNEEKRPEMESELD